MNIETLKIFKDLIETQSFTKTAEMNFVSQSAVSQQIKKLELIFKTKLFIKKREKIKLTDVGKILYDGAKEIVNIYDKTVLDINKNFDLVSNNTVKISSIYTVGIYFIENYIKHFISKYPASRISLDYYECNNVIERVLSGQSDFGFIASKKVKDINISCLHLDDEEMVVISPTSFNKINSSVIKFSELSDVKLILFEKSLPTRKLVESFLKENNIDLNVTMEMSNVETIKSAVSSNVGFSILPYSSAIRDVKDGKFKMYRFEKPLFRSIYMIYNKRRKFTGYPSLFINFILGLRKKYIKV